MNSAAVENGRIPVTLLTGFLGSGKTTLLNRWLRDPALSKAAVIVNEFGDVGIDHTLIRSSNDQTIELTTGCICCTPRGELVETFRDLLAQAKRRQIPTFESVLVETTGLADPIPPMQALVTLPLARDFQFSRLITTVDAVNAAHTIATYPEASRQMSLADTLVLTKCDLKNSDGLVPAIRHLNSHAKLYFSTASDAPRISTIFNDKWVERSRHLTAETKSDVIETPGHRHADLAVGDQIVCFDFNFTEPLEWNHVMKWLNTLADCGGEDLLRVKGILNVSGRDRPIALHIVQNLFPAPVELPTAFDDKRESQIVFITRGIPREFVWSLYQSSIANTPAQA